MAYHSSTTSCNECVPCDISAASFLYEIIHFPETCRQLFMYNHVNNRTFAYHHSEEQPYQLSYKLPMFTYEPKQEMKYQYLY